MKGKKRSQQRLSKEFTWCDQCGIQNNIWLIPLINCTFYYYYYFLRLASDSLFSYSDLLMSLVLNQYAFLENTEQKSISFCSAVKSCRLGVQVPEWLLCGQGIRTVKCGCLGNKITHFPRRSALTPSWPLNWNIICRMYVSWFWLG